MNIKQLPLIMAFAVAQVSSFFVNGQAQYVKQVITANGGRFEYSPPFMDYVTLQAYHPAGGSFNVFGTVKTQSVQDLLISGGTAFLTAQDSIVKFSLNTFQRTGAVADSGLNKLCVYDDKLIVTKQYPLSACFVEVLDTADLGLIALVFGIPGDCGGAVVMDDTLYVTVNGGWMGTEGKIAVIETAGWTLKRIVNLGPQAIGAANIYAYNGKIFTVNKSPYGVPSTGSVSVFDPVANTFYNKVLNVNVGNGVGVFQNLLYLGLDYGIGSFNLNTLSIEDTVIVPDPGTASFRYILSAALDTINHRIYANIGDYLTQGICRVTAFAGDSLTSYATGISSDAVSVDYRKAPVGNGELSEGSSLIRVYPNPATHYVYVDSKTDEPPVSATIMDLTGRILLNSRAERATGSVFKINIRHIPAGIYLVKIVHRKGSRVTRLVVQ